MYNVRISEYGWKRFLSENPLLVIGALLLAIWFVLAMLDLGIVNQDLKFALNWMALIGTLYGLFLVCLGVREYFNWKKEVLDEQSLRRS